MKTNRRQFISGTVAAAAAAAASAICNPTAAHAADFKGKLRRAMIVGPVIESALHPIKEAGFEGVETRQIGTEEEAARGRAVADSLGLRVHSVMRGWMDFNSTDPAKVQASLEATRKALRAAKAYGADAILLVPCRVINIPMPQPWEFDVEFDEKTGHVSRVVKEGANKFDEYIAAQNRATDTSRAAVEKLLPLAEELKIIIGLENVWNNLWVTPALYQHFVSSFANPWARAYFDIGNHVKYSPPQVWIKTLGSLICKLHVKDFKLNPDGHGGKFVHPRDGDINWPAVRKALDEAGYDGWATIEDDGLPLAEFNKRFTQIADGQ